MTRLPLLLAAVALLATAGLGDDFLVRIQNRGDRLAPLLLKLNTGTPGLTLRVGQWDSLDGVYPVPEASWRRLPDLDLLRFGDIAPDELHPLIGASLFPERPPQPTEGPPGPAVQPSAPVRVRCRGEWHWVQSRNGRLDIPHTEEEERRERAMRAFGGPVTGCFAAQQAWTSGAGRLPKALREQREELFAWVQHGDTAEVLRLLDAGVDPHIRDGRQRTLLHHFANKEALFKAVVTAVSERATAQLVVAVGDRTDPVDVVRTAALAWIDLAGDPVIQRIVLVDAPSVLGWEQWRAMDEGRTVGIVAQMLQAVSDTGRLPAEFVQPFAHMILAALDEAAMVVARAPDTRTAVAESRQAVEELLNRLLRP